MSKFGNPRASGLPWPLGPVAHRGLHDSSKGIIENTASAILAAIGKGYAVEIDVQAAQGGHPVVFHDETLDRLMEADGLVSDRSVAELKRLAYRGTSDRILALEEFLELAAARVPLYIEIKTNFGEPGIFEEHIAERINAYHGPVTTMSFDHRSAAAMRDLSPGVPRGMISYRWDDGWMPDLQAAERQRLRELSYHEQVHPSFIAYDIDDLPDPVPLNLKRALGIPLLAWTVRTPEQRARAKNYADAIIFEGFEA